ncbi:hypothetical protein GGI11_001871 [Coemansia sp. RSA 2049]|nr:hypothetical protein GGI11_001871 [Coemansia sp. RSA 2049]
MLAPEAGTLDRFYCDIYVQDEPIRDAKTSSQPHVLKDIDELHIAVLGDEAVTLASDAADAAAFERLKDVLGMKLNGNEDVDMRDTGDKSSVESFAKRAGWSFAEATAETESTCLNSDPHASDDDDSWLSLHPDELDELMRKASSVLADAPQCIWLV